MQSKEEAEKTAAYETTEEQMLRSWDFRRGAIGRPSRVPTGNQPGLTWRASVWMGIHRYMSDFPLPRLITGG